MKSSKASDALRQELLQVVDMFRQAARNAIDVGFDGVEVHGANVSKSKASMSSMQCTAIADVLCCCASLTATASLSSHIALCHTFEGYITVSLCPKADQHAYALP